MRERVSERETHTHRHRHTQTDRDRETETEIEKSMRRLTLQLTSSDFQFSGSCNLVYDANQSDMCKYTEIALFA